VEEPQLREHERSSEERRGGDAERRGDQRHEGHEPDEVLGRHEAREREEYGNSRRRGGDEPLRTAVAAGEQPGDEQNSGDLDDGRRDGDRIGQRPREIAGERERGATDDLGVVGTKAVQCQQHRAAEALDLKRPLALGLDAAPEPVPAQKREGADNGDDDPAEGKEWTDEPAPPDGEAEQRQQRGGIDLGGEREPE
jgi:hypothetical protein